MSDLPTTLKGKLLLQYDLFCYDLHRVPERIWMWTAWHLPKKLVLWAAVRLMAHATTGKYGSTNATHLTILDALQRWED